MKLTSMMRNMPAASIPPLVFQLLHFVKNDSHMSRELLINTNEFFSSQLTTADREGEPSNLDLDSIELVENERGTAEELMQAESTGDRKY